METAQFCKAYDTAWNMGFVMTRGVGGRLFVVWRKGTDGRQSKRFESIQAALAYCMDSREFRIVCRSDSALFWSNRHGWTDKDSADIFPAQMKMRFSLPIEGAWMEIEV